VEHSLIVNEKNFSIESSITENHLQANIGGQHFEINFNSVDPHYIQMIVDGKSVNAYVHSSENGKIVLLNGESYWIQDEDWLKQNDTQSSGLKKEQNLVTPPMPAIVISVPVNSGDTVSKGQAVVVISAMKMETTLVSPFDGIVETINVKEGDKVMPGDILIDIKQTDTIE
jgi:biotin carboxyl carrier protein